MPNNYLPRYKIENSTLLANEVIQRFVSRHHLTQVASSLTKYKLQVIFLINLSTQSTSRVRDRHIGKLYIK